MFFITVMERLNVQYQISIYTIRYMIDSFHSNNCLLIPNSFMLYLTLYLEYDWKRIFQQIFIYHLLTRGPPVPSSFIIFIFRTIHHTAFYHNTLCVLMSAIYLFIAFMRSTVLEKNTMADSRYPSQNLRRLLILFYLW